MGSIIMNNFLSAHNLAKKCYRIISIVSAVIVVAIAQAAFSPAALATPQQLCTTDNFNGCWRDSNNSGSSDNPVVIANKCSGSCPAQGIEAIDQHTTYNGDEV